jgi:hypothetical protein
MSQSQSKLPTTSIPLDAVADEASCLAVRRLVGAAFRHRHYVVNGWRPRMNLAISLSVGCLVQHNLATQLAGVVVSLKDRTHGERHILHAVVASTPLMVFAMPALRQPL